MPNRFWDIHFCWAFFTFATFSKAASLVVALRSFLITQIFFTQPKSGLFAAVFSMKNGFKLQTFRFFGSQKWFLNRRSFGDKPLVLVPSGDSRLCMLCTLFRMAKDIFLSSAQEPERPGGSNIKNIHVDLPSYFMLLFFYYTITWWCILYCCTVIWILWSYFCQISTIPCLVPCLVPCPLMNTPFIHQPLIGLAPSDLTLQGFPGPASAGLSTDGHPLAIPKFWNQRLRDIAHFMLRRVLAVATGSKGLTSHQKNRLLSKLVHKES